MDEVALGNGANSHCVAMHCRLQRMLAPLAAGVGLHIGPWPSNRPSAQTDRQTHTANNYGLMRGRPGSDRARASLHEP